MCEDLCLSQSKVPGQDVPRFVLLMMKAKIVSSSQDIAQGKKLSHVTRSSCPYI